MILKFKVGDSIGFEMEVSDPKQAIVELAFWTGLPTNCPLCGADVRFFHRSPQEFNYYGLFCLGKVTHETNFGQKKIGGGLFYKGAHSWRESAGYTEEGDAPPPTEAPPLPDESPVKAPQSHAQPSKASEEASVPPPPKKAQGNEEGKAGKSAKEVRQDFYNALLWLDIDCEAMTSEELKGYFTKLNDGKYPAKWDAETFNHMGGGALKFLKAIQRVNPQYRESRIPHSAAVDYRNKVMTALNPIESVYDISASEWNAMAFAIEKAESQQKKG